MQVRRSVVVLEVDEVVVNVDEVDELVLLVDEDEEVVVEVGSSLILHQQEPRVQYSSPISIAGHGGTS